MSAAIDDAAAMVVAVVVMGVIWLASAMRVMREVDALAHLVGPLFAWVAAVTALLCVMIPEGVAVGGRGAVLAWMGAFAFFVARADRRAGVGPSYAVGRGHPAVVPTVWDAPPWWAAS